jgi:hypothetical protein
MDELSYVLAWMRLNCALEVHPSDEGHPALSSSMQGILDEQLFMMLCSRSPAARHAGGWADSLLGLARPLYTSRESCLPGKYRCSASMGPFDIAPSTQKGTADAAGAKFVNFKRMKYQTSAADVALLGHGPVKHGYS